MVATMPDTNCYTSTRTALTRVLIDGLFAEPFSVRECALPPFAPLQRKAQRLIALSF